MSINESRCSISILTILIVFLFSACSKEDAFTLKPQKWGDIMVMVNTEPTPVSSGGMNEFWIKAVMSDKRAAHNLIIAIRSGESAQWKQAIQDGHTGVYRRALDIKNGQKSLYVSLRKKKGDGETVLEFPLFEQKEPPSH